jgi:hypothetical protein
MSDKPDIHSVAAPGSSHSHSKHPHRKRSRKKLPSGKALAWLGSIVTAAIVAFIAAFATVLGTNAASPSPSPSAASTSLTGDPVQVALGNVDGADSSMALPNPVELSAKQLAGVGTENDVPGSASDAWFAAHDAAFVGQANIQLVLQGNRHDLVRITNILPVEECSAPLDGTMFFAPGQGGQELSAHLYLNLDDPRLPASYTLPASSRRYPDYFGQYSISLSLGQQLTIQIAASTQRQYCALTLDLIVLDDGKTYVERVSDHGKPFRVTPEPATGSNGKQGFSSYHDLYLGGAAIPDRASQDPGAATAWIRGNPHTFTW